MQKIPLITVILLLLVVVSYLKGYKPQDNTYLKDRVTMLERDIRDLNEKIKQSKLVVRLKPAEEWDVYYKLNRLGYKIDRVADGRVHYKPNQGRNALEILLEVMQCRSLFGNACILEGIKPLEISVYIG